MAKLATIIGEDLTLYEHPPGHIGHIRLPKPFIYIYISHRSIPTQIPITCPQYPNPPQVPAHYHITLPTTMDITIQTIPDLNISLIDVFLFIIIYAYHLRQKRQRAIINDLSAEIGPLNLAVEAKARQLQEALDIIHGHGLLSIKGIGAHRFVRPRRFPREV